MRPLLAQELRDESGMTIVEVMVSAALLALVVIGLAAQQFYQTRIQGDAQLSNKARQTIDSILASVSGSASRFPAFWSGGTPTFWAACFSEDGQMILSAATAPAGAALDFALISGVSTTTSAFDTPVTNFCNANVGGYEVHIYNDAANRQILISVMILSSPGRPFNPASSVFGAVLSLGVAPEVNTTSAGTVQGAWCLTPGGTGCAAYTAATCTQQFPTTNYAPGFGAPLVAPNPTPAYYFCF